MSLRFAGVALLGMVMGFSVGAASAALHDRHVVMGILFAAASLCLALPSAAFACDLPPGQKAALPRSGTERRWR